MALFVNLKKFLNNRNDISEMDAKTEEKDKLAAVLKGDDDKIAVAAGDRAKKLAALTPREKQLLALLLEGCTLQQCADKLSIKYPTANTHITSIYKKLDVSSRPELIIKYREHNR